MLPWSGFFLLHMALSCFSESFVSEIFTVYLHTPFSRGPVRAEARTCRYTKLSRGSSTQPSVVSPYSGCHIRRLSPFGLDRVCRWYAHQVQDWN
ncbi:hypothetical protein OBBRIDRAFT_792832 [Obba rivulosa]|uniref:Secreted protein n=1 Tax=Obba rivulosa TaxID=1052685 RepID=A0A8E2AXF2_9APHY|nr:hypothetical protein OBBRIDRAFT_792832 [Obba rivulosa]